MCPEGATLLAVCTKSPFLRSITTLCLACFCNVDYEGLSLIVDVNDLVTP